MTKQFAVIGLGRFGSSLAKTLYKSGHQVLAVDNSHENIQKMMDEVTHCVQADATDEDALKNLGLRNFDVVVVAIGHDMQSSILVTVLLKELGVPFVVAKANSALHGKVLARVGADKVVYPERDMGERLAKSLVSSNVLDYIDISPEHSIMEIVAGEHLSNKTIGELNLRAKYGITVMVIKSKGKIQVAPGANDLINTGDVLVAIGKTTSLQKIAS
ncbi:MAG: TrkA family potassium uptake protein [Dehalobacterium sp.]